MLPSAPSTYYEYKARGADPEHLPPPRQRDRVLEPGFARVWHENQRVYGARKAWRQLNRKGPTVARCTVRWLMSQRRSQGWGTTNETSFAILGLTDHLLATSFNEAAANTGYTVQVNGRTVASGNLGRGEPAISLTIPMDDLQVGDNEIVLTQSGGGRLYFVLNGRMYLPYDEIEAAGGVHVTRTYRDAETGLLLESIQPGQLVEVRLTVDLPDDGSYIIIEDRLPGGLEALNEGLATTSHVADAYSSPTYYWRELGYNYKEIRGDRVSFFVTEMDGRLQTFTYFARATQAGSFTAMPAEVYAMYDTAVWGRSASNQIVIESE